MKTRRPSAYQIVIGNDIDIVVPAAKLSSVLNTVLHTNGGTIAVDVIVNSQFWYTHQRVSNLYHNNKAIENAGFEHQSQQHRDLVQLTSRLYKALQSVTERSTRCDYMIIVNNRTRRSIINKVMEYYKQCKQSDAEAERSAVLEVDLKSEPSLFQQLFPSIDSYTPLREASNEDGDDERSAAVSKSNSDEICDLEYMAIVLDDVGVKKLSFLLSRSISETVKITPIYRKYRVRQFLFEQVATFRPVITPIRIMLAIVAVVMFIAGFINFAMIDLGLFLVFTGFYIMSLDYSFAGMSIYGTLQDETPHIQDYSTYYHRQKIIETGVFLITVTALVILAGITAVATGGDIITPLIEALEETFGVTSSEPSVF